MPAKAPTPHELAIDLAYKQTHPDAIAVALKRRCGMGIDEADQLVADLAEELAEARIDGQTAICERLWSIGFGTESGKGVGTLTALAHQHCGWSSGGVTEDVQKALVAATKGQFKPRLVG